MDSQSWSSIFGKSGIMDFFYPSGVNDFILHQGGKDFLALRIRQVVTALS